MTKLTKKSAYTIYKLCKINNIDVTNLQLNKLLYFAQIWALGEYNISLMDSEFRATLIGPIDRDLYDLLKAYGRSPIRDVFPNNWFKEEDKEYNILKDIVNTLGKLSNKKLVDITKQHGSAYLKVYVAHCIDSLFGYVITNKDLLEEYNYRKEN